MLLPDDRNNEISTCKQTTITILRHAEGTHNVDKTYPLPDAPLTSKGKQDASEVIITPTPDLILISPMTRTIQTAIAVFGDLITTSETLTEVQIWPELRESFDRAICNRGTTLSELRTKFPFPAWNFDACHEEWDYERHTFEVSQLRAQTVRAKVKALADTGRYAHILLVGHRGFIEFLVQGDKFATCESRSYEFADDAQAEDLRYSLGVLGMRQDFGPNVLIPTHAQRPVMTEAQPEHTV